MSMVFRDDILGDQSFVSPLKLTWGVRDGDVAMSKDRYD